MMILIDTWVKEYNKSAFAQKDGRSALQTLGAWISMFLITKI